ncbi:hypothetical protein ACIP5N_32085 [Streptomyces sp. NPDC088768]|uniref:hypothetical protein n=1 Tax=Streptomyces sp. NPDC088768 TaxID=3365894 RepID=UPI00382A986B
MEITTAATTTVVRAGAKGVVALIGHYKPTGIPRVGSAEDRASEYRLMLDASTRGWQIPYASRTLQDLRGGVARRLSEAQWAPSREAAAELIIALNRVRLCGTASVIAAAEELCAAVAEVDPSAEESAFEARVRNVVEAQGRFLTACREDLKYSARWWQLRRRRAERQYLKAQQEEGS